MAAGTVLGKVGNTGYGPPGHRDEFPWHLHFGIEVGSEWVDPFATLVSLYAATVRATARSQAILDQLADEGRSGEWDHLAARTYMRWP